MEFLQEAFESSNPYAKEIEYALSGNAEDYVNNESIETAWAIKCYENTRTHMSLICSCDPSYLKLSTCDDLIYDKFRRTFPDFDVKILDEEKLKSPAAKQKWREFIEEFKTVIDHYNEGFLVRLDSSGNYDSANTILDKSILLDTSLVSVYDSYDDSPFIENITNGMVKFLDLTIPHYGIPVYDWIFSIEVAEHIPVEYEGIYLSNVIRHAREGILVSWAVPGQGGLGHVNLQTHENVIKKLSPYFAYDKKSSAIFQSEAVMEWLKNNLVFHRSQQCVLDEIHV